MTVSRPKKSTLFSLGAFVVLILGACAFLVLPVFSGKELPAWKLVLLLIMGPTSLGLVLRMVWTYKYIEVRKDKFRIVHPLRPGGNWDGKYKDVDWWKETSVKTTSGVYREAEVYFSGGKKLKFSMQEYTEYKRLLGALERQAGRKKLKD